MTTKPLRRRNGRRRREHGEEESTTLARGDPGNADVHHALFRSVDGKSEFSRKS